MTLNATIDDHNPLEEFQSSFGMTTFSLSAWDSNNNSTESVTFDYWQQPPPSQKDSWDDIGDFADDVHDDHADQCTDQYDDDVSDTPQSSFCEKAFRCLPYRLQGLHEKIQRETSEQRREAMVRFSDIPEIHSFETYDIVDYPLLFYSVHELQKMFDDAANERKAPTVA